jgi:predicted AlkP superfamily phosphohydrolase/phosphomutase
MIGRVLNFVDNDTTLILLSDHGMTNFDYGININTWLYENNYLRLKTGVKPGGEENERLLRNVNWNHTQAYAYGLTGIYINIEGRESNGIVKSNELEDLSRRISKQLTGIKNPNNGEVAIQSVLPKNCLYSGHYVDNSPDLIVNYSPGYRVSWDTPLGGVPERIFSTNMKKWSGDHVVEPKSVPGVLYMNKNFIKDNVNLTDMAPTILAAFGLNHQEPLEGRPILI